jgi:hypothetical protein
MRGTVVIATFVVGFLMISLVAGLARANGAAPLVFTQTFHDATLTMPVTFPCVGAPPGTPGSVTILYNGVFHMTVLTAGVGAGTGWVTMTATGSFVFTPDDKALPTFTGHVTVWDGASFNLKSFAATGILNIRATGSDGSTVTFHDVMHITVIGTDTSTPRIVVSFDKPTCA